MSGGAGGAECEWARGGTSGTESPLGPRRPSPCSGSWGPSRDPRARARPGCRSSGASCDWRSGSSGMPRRELRHASRSVFPFGSFAFRESACCRRAGRPARAGTSACAAKAPRGRRDGAAVMRKRPWTTHIHADGFLSKRFAGEVRLAEPCPAFLRARASARTKRSFKRGTPLSPARRGARGLRSPSLGARLPSRSGVASSPVACGAARRRNASRRGSKGRGTRNGASGRGRRASARGARNGPRWDARAAPRGGEECRRCGTFNATRRRCRRRPRQLRAQDAEKSVREGERRAEGDDGVASCRPPLASTASTAPGLHSFVSALSFSLFLSMAAYTHLCVYVHSLSPSLSLSLSLLTSLLVFVPFFSFFFFSF